jgi:hypothetical protein
VVVHYIDAASELENLTSKVLASWIAGESDVVLAVVDILEIP